jgi:hypothetical protein
MQNIILINRIEDLRLAQKGYSRLYYGNEFCPRLMPLGHKLRQLAKFIKQTKIKLTLLSSYAGSQNIARIKNAVKFLVKKNVLDEVVVNDYGVFYFIKEEFPELTVVCGRSLTRKVLVESGSFFYAQGVRRVEFDHYQNMRVLPPDVSASYYYPYSVVGATRYCVFANINSSDTFNPGIRRCSKQCLRFGCYKVANPELEEIVILKGNSMFLYNDGWNKYNMDNIDRMVFQPKVPI